MRLDFTLMMLQTARLLVMPLAGAALIVASPADVTASTPTPRPSNDAAQARKPAAPAPAPMLGGLVIGIDPETGMLVVPGPEQMARLLARRATATSATRPAPVRMPNGALRLDVRSWMREHSLARLGADGRVQPDCVSGPEALQRALATPPAATEDR